MTPAARRGGSRRSAAPEIDADGRARLVVVPGRYRVSRRRLVPAVVAGLPVEPAGPDGVGDELAAEITAWLAGQPAAPAAPGPVEPQPDPSAEPTAGGGVATLDPPRPANPRECGPLGCGRWTSSARSSGPRSPTPPRWWIRDRRSRSAPPCAAPRPGHGSSATNTPDPPPVPIARPVTSDDRGESQGAEDDSRQEHLPRRISRHPGPRLPEAARSLGRGRRPVARGQGGRPEYEHCPLHPVDPAPGGVAGAGARQGEAERRPAL